LIEAFGVETTPIPGFPEEVEGEDVCYPDECVSTGSIKDILQTPLANLLRLVVRHKRTASGFDCLVLEFEHDEVATYVELGHAADNDPLSAEFFVLERIGERTPYDLRYFAPRTASGESQFPLLPVTETWLLNELLTVSNEWDVYVLIINPTSLDNFRTEERIPIDIAELHAKETTRLELFAAKAAFTRMQKAAKTKEPTDAVESSDSESSDSDFKQLKKHMAKLPKQSFEGDELPERGKAKAVGWRWPDTPNGFLISDIGRDGHFVGVGAICPLHKNCKKHVTFGTSGCSRDTLIERVKRWCVAGLDEGVWPAGKRHHQFGGIFLADFADGLSSDDMDDIVKHMIVAD